MELLEVGLELELFLLDKNNKIYEPSLYGFPADEMGFLIELRSWHSSNADSILESVNLLEKFTRHKAKKLGLYPTKIASMPIEKEFQDYIWKKYRLDTMPDNTRNIYQGTNKSHHTGFLNDRATAGLHVHFSERLFNENNVGAIGSLDIPFIVAAMDSSFANEIEKDGRIPGEYELKSHGFEYRSLSATTDLQKVTQVALDILKESKNQKT